VELVQGLREYHANVDIHDPWVDPKSALNEYGLELIEEVSPQSYDAVVIAVSHDCFREAGVEKIRSYTRSNNVIFDVKYLFPISENLCRL